MSVYPGRVIPPDPDPSGTARARQELLSDLAVLAEVLRWESQDTGTAGGQAESDCERLTAVLSRFEAAAGGIEGPYRCPDGCGREFDAPYPAAHCWQDNDHRKVSPSERRF
jgi:hypothetical protein